MSKIKMPVLVASVHHYVPQVVSYLACASIVVMSEPGSYFAQGHGDDVDYIEPRVVVDFHSNLRPLQISCGFNHTGAILEYI